jgi:hypothetical protein
MKYVLQQAALFVALLCLAVSAAGCDSNTTDEFRDFEGSWTVADLEVADDDGETLNSVFSRLESEYSDGTITFTFSESDGVEEFNIFARRDKADTEDLNVAGDVQFSSGNDVNFIGNFAGENVNADYRFVDDQLLITAEDFEGASLLETLLPNWPTRPDTPVVRVTLERQ